MKPKDKIASGFSRLSPAEKVLVVSAHFSDSEVVLGELESYLFKDGQLKDNFLDFSENTVSSYHMPYGILPNLLLDGVLYHVPMVTEESSVVAAAASAAKFWGEHGGFKTLATSARKVGSLYFSTDMVQKSLYALLEEGEERLRHAIKPYTARMEARGGGLLSLEVKSVPNLDNQYHLMVEMDTVDSMGANFINTCMEELKLPLRQIVEDAGYECNILMAILSNYTPNSTVTVGVNAPLAAFEGLDGSFGGKHFAQRFKQAVDIAKSDIYRATTHNKGIMNGIDSVIIATGNDFRAVEASAHAFACRSGAYSSLSSCSIDGDMFKLELEIPLSVGVVGGLTTLHPLAKRSIELLGNPSAKKLMAIAASVGLASNFAAVRSLVTSGIQQGHMKMHLNNILKSYGATASEVVQASQWFATRKVSVNAVKEFLDGQRG